MVKRQYNKAFDKEISRLGFGAMRLITNEDETINFEASKKLIDIAYENGINYYDTAYVYHGMKSEEFLKYALADKPRDSYYLADKLPMWDKPDNAAALKLFEESCTRLGTDYIDFYLLHNVNKSNWKIMCDNGYYDQFMKLKEEGRIKHLGFSFHDNPDLLEEIVDKHQFDFVQIQINYLDWYLQDAKRSFEILKSRDIPIVVMEPIRGGYLANIPEDMIELLPKGYTPVENAFRYVASLPEVFVILSGMSTEEQVSQNVALFSDIKDIDDSERLMFKKAFDHYKELGAVPCTACNYCDVCPEGIAIPKIFEIYNDYTMNKEGNKFTTTTAYFNWIHRDKRADKCVGCKICESYCPQHIAIADELAKVAVVINEIK